MVVLNPERLKAVKMNILGWCSHGDEDALHDRAFWIRAGAHPGRLGLHALPRPTARQPIAGPGSGTRLGTTVAPVSPAARARVLAGSRARYWVGSQAAGPYSSRRADDPRTQGSWRRAPGSGS